MLRRAPLLVTLVAAGLTTVVSAHAGTAKDRFDLKGEVYPNYEIEMKNPANRDLTQIKAGTYRIKVEDMASIHNFRLIGPGVNKATAISRTAETIWMVRLRPGKYTFLCDPHAGTMKGSFRVGA